jgi:hypothetical protein
MPTMKMGLIGGIDEAPALAQAFHIEDVGGALKQPERCRFVVDQHPAFARVAPHEVLERARMLADLAQIRGRRAPAR